MIRNLWVFALAFLGVFIIDQNIKAIFLDGYTLDTQCISLALTLNRGVAFSMFSFLGTNLKYIQIVLILFIFIYIMVKRDLFKRFSLPFGMILGAGCSNIYDRFIHGGVLDYVYWHCGFDFAIFNFADVMIDLSVAMIFYMSYFSQKKPA